MASPYVLTNADLQYVNLGGQDFQFYLAFLNPITVTTNWLDLQMDALGNWQPPPNFDTVANAVQPYAPTANLGSNRIGFVGEVLYFDGSRSCQRFDLPVISYNWTATGPYTMNTYANKSQASITWNNPGIYTVTLQVQDRFGNFTSGTRQIMIYQDRDHALSGVISLSGLSGSLSSGGWQCQCTTLSGQFTLYNADSLQPGQYQPLVVLCETRYEVTPNYWLAITLGPHGNFSPGTPYMDPRIFFDGYVQSGTIHQDVDKDTLSFSCQGPQMILQEAKTHMLGYYNTTYATYVKGNPTSCKLSPIGAGFLVGGLMTIDVIHSLLQYHCNIGNFHDIHCWNSNIPTTPYLASSGTTYYNMTYSTLSVNEGTLWSNIQDLVTNDYAQVYCERDGGIRVGPQTNYMGKDFWNTPLTLGPQSAATLLNFARDVQGSSYSTSGSNLASYATMQLPSQPMPVVQVHPWGHQQLPTTILQPFSPPNSQIVATQQNLLGPPVLCTFSDTPIYDSSLTSPDTTGVLYPWITNNWPQDLAVYPISFDITENYTGRAALVKLIGTLYGHTSLWSSWYPLSTFQVAGNGTVSVVTSVLPASDWVVNESHVLPDITSASNALLVWNWWWEMARREYYVHNMNYTASVTLGMFTALSLNDLCGVTRQNISIGPAWNNKLFYVNEIAYNIDFTARTWQTTVNLTEVTSNNLGPIAKPPTNIPVG